MKSLSVAIIFIFWMSLTIGGSAYLVFWRGRSAWWMLVGIIMAVSLNVKAKEK